jgi:hypothetical protein
MGIAPKLLRERERVDTRLFPPTNFVAAPVHFAMMGTAQGDNELVAHLTTKGSGLCEPKVVRI